MAYTKLFSASNPGLIIILLDQSSSMKDVFGSDTKAAIAAMAVNRVISDIAFKSQSGGEIKDRCTIGVLGYGQRVDWIVHGNISDLAQKPASYINVNKKVPDGAGGLVTEQTEMPIWVTPVAENGTPMHDAFKKAHTAASQWITRQPDSFPPIVINITDGQPNDEEAAKQAAYELLKLQTNDGGLLLFNAHISDANLGELRLPNSNANLPNSYAKFLFDISSPLPDRMIDQATRVGFSPQSDARGFVFNAGAESMIKLLTFGSTGALSTLR